MGPVHEFDIQWIVLCAPCQESSEIPVFVYTVQGNLSKVTNEDSVRGFRRFDPAVIIMAASLSFVFLLGWRDTSINWVGEARR